MCLAIPSKVIEIMDDLAVIDVDGVQRKASLMLLDDVQVGDYVIVHAGYAISRLDEASARETLDLLREALAASDKNQ